MFRAVNAGVGIDFWKSVLTYIHKTVCLEAAQCAAISKSIVGRSGGPFSSGGVAHASSLLPDISASLQRGR